VGVAGLLDLGPGVNVVLASDGRVVAATAATLRQAPVMSWPRAMQFPRRPRSVFRDLAFCNPHALVTIASHAIASCRSSAASPIHKNPFATKSAAAF
jgi:hypothetical protein